MERIDFPPYYISAYGLAVRQGFVGTLEEWLESLNGHPGDSIEMRREGPAVQWRTKSYNGAVSEWRTLYLISGALPGGGALSQIVVRSGAADFLEIPAEGFYGIGSVMVEGDPDLTPGNIRRGITILGVTGTYVGQETKLAVRNVNIRENGTYTITPPSGYDGMTRVTATVAVPTEAVEAELQSKSVIPGRNPQNVTADPGFDGLSMVMVAGDSDLLGQNIRSGVTIFGVTGTYEKTEIVDAVLQRKTVMPGRTQQVISADAGYDGMSLVTVEGDNDLTPENIRAGVAIFGTVGTYEKTEIVEAKLQSKSVTPGRNSQTVRPDTGFHGLASVTVNGDANLVPGNIGKGIVIFGVTGTYVSPMKHITVVPSEDEQYILPTDGYEGFSSISVLPMEKGNEYDEGYAEGYSAGYSEGYAAGLADAVKEPVACLYEGVQLPPLPKLKAEETNEYKYVYINRWSPTQQTFFVRFLTQPIYSDGDAGYTKAPAKQIYAFADMGDSDWSQFYYVEEQMYMEMPYIIWSNTDIINTADDSIYLKASDPIPVYE